MSKKIFSTWFSDLPVINATSFNNLLHFVGALALIAAFKLALPYFSKLNKVGATFNELNITSLKSNLKYRVSYSKV